MKNIKVAANNLNLLTLKSVSVYKILRNDEIFYEIVYPDNGKMDII